RDGPAIRGEGRRGLGQSDSLVCLSTLPDGERSPDRRGNEQRAGSDGRRSRSFYPGEIAGTNRGWHFRSRSLTRIRSRITHGGSAALPGDTKQLWLRRLLLTSSDGLLGPGNKNQGDALSS